MAAAELIPVESVFGVQCSVFGETDKPQTEHRIPNTEHQIPLALYLHIPFCVRKCHYCDFNSGPSTADMRESYVETLCQEIRQSPWAGSPARTVFYGGGTPSELTVAQLARINEALRESFCFEVEEHPLSAGRPSPPAPLPKTGRGGATEVGLPGTPLPAFGRGAGGEGRFSTRPGHELYEPDFKQEAEWTLEANPGTVTPAILSGLRAIGFNRISLGVQSFHDHHLRAIGRIHTAAEARQAFRWAREAGFGSRNLDLIFGLPEQTLAEWEADLEEALALRPEHLSLYGLIVEEKTEFGHRYRSGRLPLPEEEIVADMYEMTLDRLRQAGYDQYEISNFALPGHECRHNLVYWRNEPYLGFGVSAASFIDGLRWTNTPSTRLYREQVERGASAAAESERLEGRAAIGEALMLALRLTEGAHLDALSDRYDCDVQALFAAEIRRYTEAGLLDWKESGRLRLTRRGLLLSNLVFAELV